MNPSFDVCPECNGFIIYIKDKGETVCNKCGLILNEGEIDLSHHKGNFYNRAERIGKQRNCLPISSSLSNSGLCTVINRNKIYNEDLKRAAKRDAFLSWENRNMLIATRELNRLGHNLNLPIYIRISAFNLYKKAFKTKIIKGRTIVGMVAACVYYTCRVHRIPRTFQEIANESSISQNSLKLCYKSLVNTLNLKVPVSDPIDLIPHFIANLGLNFNMEKLSIKILKACLKKGSIKGKNPKGWCAGAIYLASQIENIIINQKAIGKIVGITEATLRSRYKELINNIDFNSI